MKKINPKEFSLQESKTTFARTNEGKIKKSITFIEYKPLGDDDYKYYNTKRVKFEKIVFKLG
jgi:hypothetical protein